MNLLHYIKNQNLNNELITNILSYLNIYLQENVELQYILIYLLQSYNFIHFINYKKDDKIHKYVRKSLCDELMSCFQYKLFNNLIYLDCSNTDLTQLNINLINLQYLNCSNTLITEIPDTFVKLKILNIFNTKIDILASTYLELEEIYCDGSYLHKISSKLQKLKKIIINNTNITKIKYYKNLEYLNCSNNTLTQVISKYDINKLKYLICSNTLVNNFLFDQNIIFNKYNLNKYNLNNLVYLNCSNTNIEYLPYELNNLIYLNISNTLIKLFSYRTLINLEILIAYDSNLEILNNSLLKLKILNINNNHKINKIPSTYHDLEFLSIDNTIHITKLSKRFKKLKYLSCQNSFLQSIPVNYFNLYFLNIINTDIIFNNENKLLFYYY